MAISGILTAVLLKNTTKWVLKRALSDYAGDLGGDLASGFVNLGMDHRRAAAEVVRAEEIAKAVLEAATAEIKPVPSKDVSLESVAHELAQTFEASFATQALFEQDLNAPKLASSLRASRALPKGQFSKEETELYDASLGALATALVALAHKVPGYKIALDGEVLERLREGDRKQEHTHAELARIRKAVEPTNDPERVSFVKDYREALKDHLDDMDLFGADIAPAAKQYNLSVAYISLNLEASKGQSESGARAAEAILNAVPSRRLIIRGEAGSGKTTLLKWIALQGRCAEVEATPSYVNVAWHSTKGDAPELDKGSMLMHAWKATKAGRVQTGSCAGQFDCNIHLQDFNAPGDLPWAWLTPFFIRLRDCTKGMLPEVKDFAAISANLTISTPKDWVEHVLKSGRGLVLLDGIDEVPPQYRAALHKRTRALIKQFPKSMFIFTSRPLSEGEPEWLNELGFTEASVSPMSVADRDKCIDKWHDAVGRRLQDAGKPDFTLPETADNLKAALKDASEFARLATNPLLCAMLCALHHKKHRLPKSMHDLLEALTAMLLYHREDESLTGVRKEFDPIYADLSYSQRKAIVSHLARYMVDQGLSVLPHAMVKKRVGEVVDTFKERNASHAEQVVKGLMERSGMLREKTPGQIDFIHNTFKEYLAATRFQFGDELPKLAMQADSDGWENVVVFAAACAVDRPDFSEELVKLLLPPDTAKSKGARKPARRTKKKEDVAPDDAKQYRRSILAIRVAAAISTSLSTATTKRLEAVRKTLFPPRNLSAAAGLATAGNAVLKFVQFSKNLSPTQRIRCIRTLRLIGTPEAKECLNGFLDEMDADVIEELAQAVDPLSIPAVVFCYAKSTLPGSWNPTQNAESYAWRSQVREGTQRHITNVAALHGRAHIVELDLVDTQVGDAGAAALASKDSGLTALTTLNLGGTQVGDAGAAALASKDSGLTALTTLDLGDTQVGDAGAAALAAKDSGLTALTTLDLSGTQVGDAGAAALAAKDSGLTALTTLDLSSTQVGDAGAAALAVKDSGLTALTTLKLVFTEVGDAGAAALAAKDSGLTALTTLDLGDALVGDAGAAAISEAHPTLHVIH